MLLIITVTITWLANRLEFRSFAMRTWQTVGRDPLELAGLCGLIGLVSFYHMSYDKIMLFPALLAAWRASLSQPRWSTLMITLLLVFSSLFPDRLVIAIPAIHTLNVMIWSLSSIWLLWRILAGSRSWTDAPSLHQWPSATHAAEPAADG